MTLSFYYASSNYMILYVYPIQTILLFDSIILYKHGITAI